MEFVLGKIDRSVGTRATSTEATVDFEIPRPVITEAIVKYPDSAVYEEDSAATGGAAPEVTPQVIPQVTPQVIRLLNVLKEGELNRVLLMEKLGLHDRKTFRQNHLQPALEQGLVEMTQPDSPKSPTQKYRLTNAGKHLLKSMQE